MTRLGLYVVAATMVASVFVAPSHAAPADGPNGRKCGLLSTTDVTREAGWQSGEIDAGPLVTGESGTLECSIHVNNDTHSGTAVTTESATAIDGVVVMAPRSLSYPATPADEVSLCTAWYPDAGTPLYWVSPNPLVPTDTGHWDSNANSSCGIAAYTCVTGVPDPSSAICVYY